MDEALAEKKELKDTLGVACVALKVANKKDECAVDELVALNER